MSNVIQFRVPKGRKPHIVKQGGRWWVTANFNTNQVQRQLARQFVKELNEKEIQDGKHGRY